jgi:hypothetical protein
VTVETHVDDARRRVASERERTDEKRTAFERFDEAVRTVDPETPGGSGGPGGGGSGGGPSASGRLPGASGGDAAAGGGSASPSGEGCRAVRRAFAEHVEPYGGDARESPETVHEAIATEFSREVAVSLASADGGGWLTPQLKRAIVSETARRRSELTATARALDRERESLAAAGETVTAVVDWLVDNDPTPLSTLGFEALADRHERLAALRDRLDDAAARR